MELTPENGNTLAVTEGVGNNRDCMCMEMRGAARGVMQGGKMPWVGARAGEARVGEVRAGEVAWVGVLAEAVCMGALPWGPVQLLYMLKYS
jgi:hypothetical protein